MNFTLLSRTGYELPIPVAFATNLDDLDYYLENHAVYQSCVGVLTRPGLDLNNLPRFAKTGEIKAYAIPKQLRGRQLSIYIHNLQKGRPQNANLKRTGLRKAPNWTAQTRPNKPRTIADEVVERALELRAKDVIWREIARITKTNLEGIRSAIRKRRSKETVLSQS
jgi:hypothetical protein